MRLEEDMKYDYKDVLIRPKRSTLGSRKEVDLNRGFTFRNYTPPMVAEPTAEPGYPATPRHYRGVPIMAANMDGVGTFEIADTLAKQDMFTCLVKTYSVEQLVEYFGPEYRKQNVAMSIGITDADAQKFHQVYAQVG